MITSFALTVITPDAFKLILNKHNNDDLTDVHYPNGTYQHYNFSLNVFLLISHKIINWIEDYI